MKKLFQNTQVKQNKKAGHCSLSQKQYYALLYLFKKLGRGLKSSNFSSFPHDFQYQVTHLLKMRGRSEGAGVLGYTFWQPLLHHMSVCHMCMSVSVDSVYKCVTFSVIAMPRKGQGRDRINAKDNCHWSIYLMVWKCPIRAVCMAGCWATGLHGVLLQSKCPVDGHS